MPDGVENAADGLGEEDQIGLGNGFGERRAAVDGPRGHGVGDGARGTDPGDWSLEPGLAQGEAERRADQAGADDGYAFHVKSLRSLTASARPCCVPRRGQ